MCITLAIVCGNIADFTVFIVNRQKLGIDESLIRCQVQLLITLEHLGMQVGIYLNGITLNKGACCLVVAFALDALNLGKQTGNEGSQLNIIGDFNVGFTIALNQFDGITVLITPMCYQCTVTHVSFFELIARCNADELSHKAVHHIGVIL